MQKLTGVQPGIQTWVGVRTGVVRDLVGAEAIVAKKLVKTRCKNCFVSELVWVKISCRKTINVRQEIGLYKTYRCRSMRGVTLADVKTGSDKANTRCSLGITHLIAGMARRSLWDHCAWCLCSARGLCAIKRSQKTPLNCTWLWHWSRLVQVLQGLLNVPFWVYWTSPYSSHYRPYT